MIRRSLTLAPVTGLPALVVPALALAAPAFAQTADPADHAHHHASPPAQTPADTAAPTPSAPTPPAEAPAATAPSGHAHHGSGGEDHANDTTLVQTDRTYNPGSGTSRLPGYDMPMSGLHIMPGDDWMLMAHGAVSLQHTDHGGPRGDDKTYATSMAMLSASKDTRWGGIELRTMVSLEPAMSARGYPNLFATGETAGGEALVDRQHPHDLFMELAAKVRIRVDGGELFLYGGPVGEPALGPSAFMHRGSAHLNPEPPITHHWFDSSHITYGVATVGYAAPRWQVETSLFTGREPDEKRWNIEKPRFDSWSVRATWNPTPAIVAQVSHGRLKEPEALHPGEDEARTTASVHYANGKGVSAMLAFSAKDRRPGPTLTAWLAEASWQLGKGHTVFGRLENVRNDELFDHDHPLHEGSYRVTKMQVGYAYQVALARDVYVAFGGSGSAYRMPSVLKPYYGKSPLGWTGFIRLSLGK